MNNKIFSSASILAIIAVLFTVGIALAHTSIHVGNYDVEVGWRDEPAVTGQRNAVVVNVSDTTAADAVVDISKLVVNVTYGGESKTLELQPLSEESTNQYIAPILPTIPGEYTIQLRGKLGETDVNVDVQPEEVASTETLAFPAGQGGQGGQGQRGGFGGAFGLTTWLAGGALLLSIVALVLGILALRKARA